MLRRSNHRIVDPGFFLEAGLCVLLVVLCLYNPFFTIFGASQISTLQHHADDRATVAGSELRRCTFEASPDLAVSLQVALFAVVYDFRIAGTQSFPLTVPTGSVQQQNRESLWFRPPPAVPFVA
jgi:hypothetical protein